MWEFWFLSFFLSVSEVVQTLQLSTDKDQIDIVGDLCVCLDGMQVDPEVFSSVDTNDIGESIILAFCRQDLNVGLPGERCVAKAWHITMPWYGLFIA